MCKRSSNAAFLVSALMLVLVSGPVLQAELPDAVGLWTFQGDASDSGTGGNDGQLVGDAAIVRDPERGQCLELAGDGYAEIDSGVAELGAASFTIGAWIQTSDISLCVLSKSDGDPSWESMEKQLYVNAVATGEGGVDGSVDYVGWGCDWVRGSITVDDGLWHHVCVTWDGTTGHAYVDGEEGTGELGFNGGGDNDGDTVRIGFSPGEHSDHFLGRIDDVAIFDVALSPEQVIELMTIAGGPENAANPSPADEQQDVPIDVVLSWTPGEFAHTHNVYFGTGFDDVNEADTGSDLLVGPGQTDTSYDPDRPLDFGQTYYWRVDEVNAAPDNAVFKGAVWSFTVEPFAYPIAAVVATSNATSDAGVGPERTVDGSGLDADDQHSTVAGDMWLGVPSGADPIQLEYEFDRVYKLHQMLVWNYNVQFELMLGFGLEDVTVEYSENGTDWTVLGDVVFAQATARSDYTANTTVAFGGVAAKFVRLTVNAGYGPMGQFGLSEVRFLFIPAHAREPQPADGETAVAVDTALAWRAGREAATHDVYLGAAPDALTRVDSVSANSYVPTTLEFGGTYFWKIDEVNEVEAISLWAGDLWSFTAQEFAAIDDFESYDDEDNRIFDAWLDGFVNNTGSTVGYFEAPFAEQTIVNSGGQSMPLEYNNADAPFYSEAELDLGSADWTTNGADTLRLFVAGQAPSFLETADGTIIMNAIGTDIWDSADEFRYAYKSLTGNGSMVARVDALDGAPSTWAKVGVMVRQDTSVGSRHSFMCMTGGDGNGASWQGRLTDNASSENTDATSAVAPPYWVRIDRAGDSLTGSISPDGETWTQLGSARSIAMTDPVLIGLALTSHNANMATSAVFSNVSMTGSGGDVWQVAEIGVAQPEGNIPEALYVVVEDTSGNVAVVTHPDPGATAVPGWNEWLIPYSDLAGVNLSRVAIMYIGVGNRDNPTAGGTGLIFIDDIGYGHRNSVE